MLRQYWSVGEYLVVNQLLKPTPCNRAVRFPPTAVDESHNPAIECGAHKNILGRVTLCVT